MKIGFVGLGLLGLPRALAVATRGHSVRGYDADPRRMTIDWYPGAECSPSGETLAEIAGQSDFAFAPLDEVVATSEIIFLAVQTPSAGGYNGTTPFPADGVDYNLQPLRNAFTRVVEAAERAPAAPRVLCSVSTVLPGTLRGLAQGLTPQSGLTLAHTPEFSAVGSILRDCLNPEFFLIGVMDDETGQRVKSFCQTLGDSPIFVTGLENAELIKTSYNGYIGLKIGFANTLMEIAHKVPGCDVDVVSDCLSLATRRLISSSYLRGGLGDGGGCHPKENSALSVLARRLDLSFDPFGMNMIARDRQTEWMARLIADEQQRTQLPVWLLGTAFKANVSVEEGSPALLLLGALHKLGLEPQLHDPLVPARWNPPPATSALFVIGAPHNAFREFAPAAGSVIVDPWHHVVPSKGVRILAVGRATAPAL